MQVTPYIIFNGQCEEALHFYEKALNGQIKDLSRYGDVPDQRTGADKQKVMHAQFAVDGNTLLMASDDGSPDGQTAGSGMVHLSLHFTNAGNIESTFARLSEGGTINMPLQDTFWGARFGMLTDKFGVNWMLNYDKPKE